MAVSGQASFDTLFRLVRSNPETTRTELVAATGLSKATVSEAITELMHHGFLTETGKRQLGRGRSQVVLSLRAQQRLVFGAQLGAGTCRVALCDLTSRPIAVAERIIDGLAPESYVQSLAECVEELRSRAAAPILGIGIGVPGHISPDKRTVLRSASHGWSNVPLCDLLEARTGLRVVIENRAKVGALGEYWQGTFPEAADRNFLIYVYAGAVILCGFVFNGQLYVGQVGASGELGHITVQPDGPPCGCGNHGCLHTVASESAMYRTVRSQLRQRPDSVLNDLLAGKSLESITLPMLLQAATQEDALVLESLQTTGTWLGLAIANLINLISPSAVVIGGPLAAFGEALVEPIRQEVRKRALWDALHSVSIVPSALGDSAIMTGGSALLLDRTSVSQIIEAT